MFFNIKLLTVITALFIKCVEQNRYYDYTCRSGYCNVQVINELNQVIDEQIITNGNKNTLRKKQDKSTENFYESLVPVLLFSNSIFSHINGGNITFSGNTKIQIKIKNKKRGKKTSTNGRYTMVPARIKYKHTYGHSRPSKISIVIPNVKKIKTHERKPVTTTVKSIESNSDSRELDDGYIL